MMDRPWMMSSALDAGLTANGQASTGWAHGSKAAHDSNSAQGFHNTHAGLRLHDIVTWLRDVVSSTAVANWIASSINDAAALARILHACMMMKIRELF